ncbi:hypothetical protein L798_01111 [Zootermopsis nevadensis]|uniref:Uncharacterized protein n=1 Tax=Zootermopsis nevadensis TaxID=136037 RepID=A0A067QJZ1_ZOONE|nr:hypothetical protein L798_01111 [Zootermopsis nevadensis]
MFSLVTNLLGTYKDYYAMGTLFSFEELTSFKHTEILCTNVYENKKKVKVPCVMDFLQRIQIKNFSMTALIAQEISHINGPEFIWKHRMPQKDVYIHSMNLHCSILD